MTITERQIVAELVSLYAGPVPANLYYLGKPIRSSRSNTVSKKPTNYLHRDHDVGTGSILCGLGPSLSASCKASIFGSFPVSAFRRVADVLNAQAPHLPLTIGHSFGGELVRTPRTGSASYSTASSSALDRVVYQAVCYRRLCFLLALPRIGGRWLCPKIPRLGGPVFGLLAGGKFPPKASLWITIPVGLLGGVEAAPASGVAASAFAAGAAGAAGAAVAAGAADAAGAA